MAEKKRKSGPWLDVWKRLKKNKLAIVGIVILGLVILISVFAPFIAPYGYMEQDYAATLQFPGKEHLFGTDNFGRDIFSRIIYGGRYSLIIGIGCVSIAAVIGSILGIIAAFYSKFDNIIMRMIDIVMGIPSFLLAISIAAALGTGLRNLMIAVSITSLPAFTRVVRAQVMTVKEQEFIEAVRSIGGNNFRIIFRHILPNALAPIIVQFTLGAVNSILWAASLSFIGLGIQPPSPEWGAMLSAGRTYLRDNWYMSVFPGLAIMITTYSLNLIGDGLRDALDPRLKQ